MTELQEQVSAFVQRHRLEAGIELRTLDLVSEVGELAKEVLKLTRYGQTAFAPSPAFAAELGDVLFSVICLANTTGADLEEVLAAALKSYEERIGKAGTPESGVA